MIPNRNHIAAIVVNGARELSWVKNGKCLMADTAHGGDNDFYLVEQAKRIGAICEKYSNALSKTMCVCEFSFGVISFLSHSVNMSFSKISYLGKNKTGSWNTEARSARARLT
jgi:hypothetical protein